MADDAQLIEAKKQIREQAKEARAALSMYDKYLLSQAACGLLNNIPRLQTAKVVAVYSAMPDEVSLAMTIRELNERLAVVAFPACISERDMIFYEIHPGDRADFLQHPNKLSQGFEPSKELSLSDLEAVIVPGVAFDEQGHRLGYGGGYYDTLFEKLETLGKLDDPDFLIVGVAFDEQIVPEVPVGELDRTIPLVVTPTRIIDNR